MTEYDNHDHKDDGEDDAGRERVLFLLFYSVIVCSAISFNILIIVCFFFYGRKANYEGA